MPSLWTDGVRLESQAGVKQGGVISPALFCALLQKILLMGRRLFPNVRWFSYMDDVTLAGPIDETIAAF